MSKKEKEVLLSIIDMYKHMPYLWEKDHKDYKNMGMRNEAFKVLLEMYKTFDDDATIKILKRKLENMRTTYTKELKKIHASKHSGAGVDEVYVPSLWYFEAFNFLCAGTEYYHVKKDPLDVVISTSDEETMSFATSSSGQQNKRKKNTILEKQETKLFSAENLFKQKDEECEVYGRSIGFQLKYLNEKQLTIAQKLISDVIFYGKLDKLNENTYVCRNPSCE